VLVQVPITLRTKLKLIRELLQIEAAGSAAVNLK
jgi:hypothetical protein